MKRLNLINQKYNQLSVIDYADPINGRSAWLCKCDCGNFKVIKTEELRSSGTKSCGCLNNKQRSLRADKMYSKKIKYSPAEASARKVWKNRYKEMPFEDFYLISQNNCFYCGNLPANIQNASTKFSSQNMKQNGDFIYNGLDRIDNSKNHSKENCVACCKYCNYAKRERSFSEFKEWINRVYLKLNNIE